MLAYVVSFDRECHCITRIPTLSNTGTLRIKIDPVKRKSLNGEMMSSMNSPRPTPQYNSPRPPRPSPQYNNNNSPRPPRPSPQYNNNSPRPSPQYNLPRPSPPTPRGFRSSPSRGYNMPPPRPFVGATTTTSPRGRSPMYVSSRPPVRPPSLQVQSSVKFLVESGFTLQKARLALDRAGGDQQKAMNLLLDGKI